MYVQKSRLLKNGGYLRDTLQAVVTHAHTRVLFMNTVHRNSCVLYDIISTVRLETRPSDVNTFILEQDFTICLLIRVPQTARWNMDGASPVDHSEWNRGITRL